MTSPPAVILGASIAFSTVGLFVLAITLFSVCVKDKQPRDRHRENQQRLERARRRHQQEQRARNDQRYRDAVMLLLQRGEALKGVPIAFQLPHQPEVSARRTLRNRHARSAPPREFDMRLEDEAASGLGDAEVLRISRLPLEELLADGRPRDADPGPDVMQLLLDGQEIRNLTSSDDDDNFYFDEDMTVSVGPLVNQQGDGAEGSIAAAASSIENGRAEAGFPNNLQSSETRDWALIQELRREKRRRRRKPAEVVYGGGSEYVQNPVNNILLQVEKIQESPTSPSRLWQLISPFRPFMQTRICERKNDNTSVFDGALPHESDIPQQDDSSTMRSPFETTKINHLSLSAPF